MRYLTGHFGQPILRELVTIASFPSLFARRILSIADTPFVSHFNWIMPMTLDDSDSIMFGEQD